MRLSPGSVSNIVQIYGVPLPDLPSLVRGIIAVVRVLARNEEYEYTRPPFEVQLSEHCYACIDRETSPAPLLGA